MRLARVAVNKAADQIVRAEDVLPGGRPPALTADAEDDGTAPPARRRLPPTERRVRTTLERLRDAERQLDSELEASYRRFCGNETTALEMKRERAKLIAAFNARVMSENIRYRRMLRKAPAG